MTALHRSPNESSRTEQPTTEQPMPDPDDERATPSFDDALRGYGHDEPVDPANPGHGGRIEADRIPPDPIGPGRSWTLGAFVPLAALVGGLALAIYVWMRP